MASQLLNRVRPRFALRCWGDFAISDADSGADLRPRGRKARALLAYLAMHPDRRISRERLTALLWGDRADEQARSSLRQSLFELKAFANGAGLLAVERDAVTLCSAALATDVAEINALVRAGEAEHLAGGLPDPDERLFSDLESLNEGFDDWLAVERTRRRSELMALVADASARAVATGQVRAARALHAWLLASDPELDRPAPPLAPTPTPAPLASSKAPARTTRRGWLAGAGAAVIAGGAGAWLLGRWSVPSAEARNLVEAADAIIYKRNLKNMPEAADLYQRAIAIESDYAPAWAGLAAATAMSNRTPEGLGEAQRMARQAVALDPKLGKAHGVLGMVLGFDTPEARAAIRRGAALAPRDPELLFWLSNVHATEGNFPAQLEALRRAAAIDPLWNRASGKAALTALELGHVAEAEQFFARLGGVDPRDSFACEYAIDWSRGDYAEVVRTILALRPRLSQADMADWKLGNALLVLGHVDQAKLLLRMPPELWEIARGGPPAASTYAWINRAALAEPQPDFCLATATAQLIRAGRAGEIAELYQAREGRAGALAARDASNASLLGGGVDMALALRLSGRTDEAEALLARTDAAMQRSYAFGKVPNWLEANRAQFFAVRQRKSDAVAALKRAIDQGWRYAPVSPLPDLADVPAFAALAGDLAFEAQRARLRAHLEHERRKLGPVPI